MSIPVKEKGYSSALSFIFSLIFISLAALAAYLTVQVNGTESLIREISVWEFTIISLAAFRLTRLFVYDSIMQFFRDIFLDISSEIKNGRLYITRTKPKYHPFGLRRLFSDLLGCPWCTGVWISLATVFLFYISPYTWPFLIVLAVAGASSFLQLTINKIGWEAEKCKLECEKKE